jgi:7-cyano-7-deazaguanine synthase
MTPRERRGIVLLSGGIDSSACAHFLVNQSMDVRGVFIDHGQAAAEMERHAAASIAAHLAVSLTCYRVSGSEPFSPGEITGRNAFLTFAALLFTRAQPGLLAMGLHAGTPYYDCSEPFVADIAKLVADHTDGRVSFVAPFLTWSKAQVYDYFVSAELPLRLTYSCESGNVPPCGKCASCRDRIALGC